MEHLSGAPLWGRLWPFPPSQMLAGKARAYPNGTPFRCSTLGWLQAFSTNIVRS